MKLFFPDCRTAINNGKNTTISNVKLKKIWMAFNLAHCLYIVPKSHNLSVGMGDKTLQASKTRTRNLYSEQIYLWFTFNFPSEDVSHDCVICYN